jgi:hypothetical protein
VVRPLSKLDDKGKTDLASFISKLQPRGATPIALSLRTAGAELAKYDAFCGLVLITDGLETCKGDPAAEAATLAASGKFTFGLNVVGFDVTDKERTTLEGIARAGNGKYYDAGTAAELTDQMSDLARELDGVLEPPVIVDTSRRAIKFLPPKVEMPEMVAIELWNEGEFGSPSQVVKPVGSITKYDEYLTFPSGTKKYDVVWKGKTGKGFRMLPDYTIPERKVVKLRPEDVLGFIQVEGRGKIKGISIYPAGGDTKFSSAMQKGEKFGDVIVVPAGDLDVYVEDADGKLSLLEEGLKVEPGKLYKLQ